MIETRIELNDNNGFLNNEYQIKMHKLVLKSYKDIIDILEEVNKFCYENYDMINIKSFDIIGIFNTNLSFLTKLYIDTFYVFLYKG